MFILQIIGFVKISGFLQHPQLRLPPTFHPLLTSDSPTGNQDSVVLALVRWLEPHATAIDRDSLHRPVCPPPLHLNHCLWSFALSRRRRPACRGPEFARQLHFFPGLTVTEQRVSASHFHFARYDLLEPETFESYMNCTIVSKEPSTILETVVIPFDGN